MDNPRPEKVAVVEEVRQRISDAEAVVLTDYRGLDVPTLASLRRALRAVGGEYKVYKNSLTRFAARDLDLDLDEMLVGPTALAFAPPQPDGSPGDVVALARVLCEHARDLDELEIKGGLLGEQVLAAAEVEALSKIASRPELLAELLGLLEAPLAELASLLQAPLVEMSGLLEAAPSEMDGLLQALIHKGGAGEAPAEDAAEPGAADEAPEPQDTQPAD